MSKYLITYYLAEEIHECGCGSHDHDHDNHECGCGSHDHDDHDHHHDIRDDYELIGSIKELGPWAHLMPTSFLLRTELSSNEILDKLKDYITSKDIIFINKIDSEDFACSIQGAVNWVNRE